MSSPRSRGFSLSAEPVRLVAWIAMVWLMSAAWSLGTPLFSAPDEQAHVANAAAVVRGQVFVETTPAKDVSSLPTHDVEIPRVIADSLYLKDCFIMRSAVPATCVPAYPSAGDDLVVVDDPAANYPPLYYAVVGLPTLIIDGPDTFRVMRLVSALLFALGVGLALFSVERTLGTHVGFVTLVALTPMVTWLAGSVNPQSLEFGSAFAAVALLGLAGVSEKHRRFHLVAGGAAIALLAFSRPASLAWVVVLTVLVAVTIGMTRWRSLLHVPALRGALALSALGCVAAVIWYVAGAPGSSLRPVPDPTVTTFSDILRYTTDRLQGYTSQMVGSFGWLDTPAPQEAVLAYWLGFGGVLMTALLHGPNRVAVALGAGLVLIPISAAVIQYPTLTTAGVIWQGRYSLPLLIGLAVLGALHTYRLGHRVGRRLAWATTTIVGFVHVLSARQALERFWVGLDKDPLTLSALPPTARLGMALALVCVMILGVLWFTGCRTSPVRSDAHG